MTLPLLAALALLGFDADSLRERVERRIAEAPGAVVGVAYVGAQRGDTLFLNADTVFHAASTMKVPVMMELFRQAQNDWFRMDQGILLVNQFRSIADGSPFAVDLKEDGDSTLHGRLGTRVPVRELLRLMITRSSNLATNTLITLVGAENVTALVRRLGGRNTTVRRGVEDIRAFERGMNNVATARDLSLVMGAIQAGRPGVLRADGEMRSILLAQEFRSKIPAGLPRGVAVAHKTGEITASSHDAAIVYPPRVKPYVLVVMTRGIRDGDGSARLIADISRIVYSHATGGLQ